MTIYLKLFRESVVFAFHALVVNRLRTILSLLGVTIGIFAIIAVFTMVDSMELSVRKGVDTLGDDIIYIQQQPWAPEGGEFAWWDYIKRPKLSLPDYYALDDRVDRAGGVCFMGWTMGIAEHARESVENVVIQSASENYEQVRKMKLQAGRYLTKQEFRAGKNYAVIGASIAEGLFPTSSAVGKTIKVKGRKLRVVGVFEKEGVSMIGNSMDEVILMPILYARNIMNIRRLETMIMVKPKEEVSIKEMVNELRGVMRSIHRLRPNEKDDFALNESSLLSNGLTEVFGFFTIVGSVIGGLASLVGGFNVANIMFVTVRERTPIIGIQKSLGAKNYFILFQFLFESTLISLLGGILGLILIYLLVLLFSGIFPEIDIVLTGANVVWGLGISAGIGLVSGVVPAYFASQMDPVEAIRSN